MKKFTYISRHRFKAINWTLIVFTVIIFNAQFSNCFNKGQLVNEGAIPVFRFNNSIQNIVQAENNNLIIAGLNEIYQLKDEYSSKSNYLFFKKAFFSEPKNRHLSTNEFRNPSLIFINFKSTVLQPDCSADSNECLPVEQIQNVNRILLRTNTKEPFFFITCGTAYRGKCMLAFISDSQLVIKDTFTSNRFDLIASQNSNILIPIPQQGSYILAHGPDNRNKTLRPPILSKLKLEKIKNSTLNQIRFSFKPIIHGPQKAMINIGDDATLASTRMHFIYGFSYERYAFVLKTEQQPEKAMVTRLGRVCVDDNSFFSYSEIQLTCMNGSQIYTYANAGHFSEADTYLMRKSDVKLKANTLFLTMNAYDNKRRTIDQTKGSILCAFNIEQIMEHYSHAIENCYSGTTNPFIGTMNQYSAITKNSDVCSKVNKESDYMCLGNSVDSYVENRLSLFGTPLFKFENEIITSLAATLQKFKETDLNTFVLGSEKGKIFKLSRAFDEQLRLLHTFQMNNQSIAINPNPMVSNLNNVYLTTGEHLIKYPTSSCAIYSTCKQCFAALDNLKCGWCSVVDRNAGGCMNEQECISLGKDENLKTNFLSEICVPIIENFTPQSGPLGGNTLIEIKGENLCNPTRFERNNNYKVDVTIGNQHCRLENCTENGLTCLTSELKTALPMSNDAIKICTVDKGALEYSIDGCTSSSEKFVYSKPDVFSLEPTFGPIGGGTRLKLTGVNLDVGRNRLVKIKGVNCVEIFSNNSNLDCIVEGRMWRDNDDQQLEIINKNGEILLEIDSNKYRLDENNKQINFEFKPNPKVIDYYPKAGLRNESINITINGTYFRSAHQLQMKTSMYSIVKSSHIQLFTKCSMIEITTLICKLPKVPEEIEINSAQSPLEAELSLVPDGSLLNTTRIESNTISFYYYPLPRFDSNFDTKQIVAINSKKHCLIELKGENLSDQYRFKIRLIKLETDSSNTTNVDDMKLTDKQLFCSNVEVKASHTRIRCTIDLSNESIDNFLDTIWLVRVEFKDQDPFNAELVHLKLGPAEARTSLLSMFLILLSFVFIGIVSTITFCLYRNDKIHFVRQKEFPHFNVTYNNHHRNQTMIDAPFIRQSSQNEYHNTHQPLLGLHINSNNKLFKSDDYKERLAEENILIPLDCLKLVEKIGSGYFGCVYKGELKLPSKEPITVAVKALKNGNGDESQLIEEAFRMKDFKHQNVLTLIGVCLQDDSRPMIVLPFMKNGDLLTYVRSENNFPTIRDLLNYAIDVGNGMKYLADLRYIHRDLSCRNCMIDEKFSIKVADFGLTRDVYERNYYTSKEHKEIPLKWLAIESIEKYVSTTESDVWSYGVLLWELMTRGSVPYFGIEGYDLVKFLKSGNRLPQPDSSPDDVYEIMLDCWQSNPKMRPDFGTIVERIKAIVNDNEDYNNTYADLNVNYTNFPIQQYYLNTMKIEKPDQVNRKSSSSIYYNSSLSIASPTSHVYNTINGSKSAYSTPNHNYSIPTNSYPMSTFKNISPMNKTIEMPNIPMTETRQINLESRLDDDQTTNSDETVKLCITPKGDIEASLLTNRNDSNNSGSNISNYSTKLNRQNAIDLNEVENKTFEQVEYVMNMPQLLVDKNRLTNESNEQLDQSGENISAPTKSGHPVMYFK